MDVILLVVHVSLALGIITLVMLQRGQGASAGAVFGGGGGGGGEGGGGSGSLFGAKGSANFLSRTTAILATAFFINSIVLSYLASHREGAISVTDTVIEVVVPDTTAAPIELSDEMPVPAIDMGSKAPMASDDNEVPAAE